MKAMPIETCKSFREIFHKLADPPFDLFDLRFQALRYFLRVNRLEARCPCHLDISNLWPEVANKA